MVEIGTYIRWRDEKEGRKKPNGYVLEKGHKAMQVDREVVLQIGDKVLTYYRCTESNKLCCNWVDAGIFIKEWAKL